MMPVSLRSAWLIKLGPQAHVSITHIALDLCSWYQSRYRVDNYQVNRATADQCLGNLSACSPLSGCEISKLSVSTPSRLA